MIPTGTVTTTKRKSQRTWLTETDLRDGGGAQPVVLAVGSPEAAEAIQRVALLVMDRKRNRQAQMPGVSGRATLPRKEEA